MNTSLMHANTMDAIRPLSNDDRLAHWASKYFAAGFHRRPEKPRIRVAAFTPLSPEPVIAPAGNSQE